MLASLWGGSEHPHGEGGLQGAGRGTFAVPWVLGHPSWPHHPSRSLACDLTEQSWKGFGAVLASLGHPRGSVPAVHGNLGAWGPGGLETWGLGDMGAWGPVANGRLLSRVSPALCGRCEAALLLAPAPSHCKHGAVLCRSGFVCARVSAESRKAFITGGTTFSRQRRPVVRTRCQYGSALLLHPESSQLG